MALELRPTCEHCNKPLPPAALDARICSFECTFCAACVERLGNVCPNCGGGFVPRPIRPFRDRKGGNYLGKYRRARRQSTGRSISRRTRASSPPSAPFLRKNAEPVIYHHGYGN